MKKIPNAVLLACGLCAVCVILGGVLRFATEELRWAPLSLAMVVVVAAVIQYGGLATAALAMK